MDKKNGNCFYKVCGILILFNIFIAILIIFNPFDLKKYKNDDEEAKINKEELKNETEKETEKELDTYIDNNTIKNGLYNKNESSRYLVKNIDSQFILNQDLVVLSTFFTQEENISNGYIKDVFNNFYNTYDNIENYKIGYTISFEVGEEKLYKQILNIEDSKELYSYIQIYLYDDLKPEKNEFYSHLETINEDTLITTIKLTGSTFTDKITSPIKLGVFTYIDSDFDENGIYKGKSLYEININRS